jgi:hypothetical protein
MSLPLLPAFGPFRRFRVFLSYAREQRDVAEMLGHVLTQEGHDAFLDRHDLPAGEGFNERIRDAIRRADMFVFLISPDSVEGGGYALTELSLAASKWPTPEGRVLGVMVEPTEMAEIDPYLKVNTILVPRGDVVAETAAAIDAMRRPWRRRASLTSGGAAGIAAAAGVALYLGVASSATPPVGPTALGGDSVSLPAAVDSPIGLAPLPLDSLSQQPDSLAVPADSPARPVDPRPDPAPDRPDPEPRTPVRPRPVGPIRPPVRPEPVPVRPQPADTPIRRPPLMPVQPAPPPIVRQPLTPIRPAPPPVVVADTPRRVRRPTRVDFYIARTDSMLKVGDLAEARQALNRAIEAGADDPRIPAIRERYLEAAREARRTP